MIYSIIPTLPQHFIPSIQGYHSQQVVMYEL
jgi:hypothetical protein